MYTFQAPSDIWPKKIASELGYTLLSLDTSEKKTRVFLTKDRRTDWGYLYKFQPANGKAFFWTQLFGSWQVVDITGLSPELNI